MWFQKEKPEKKPKDEADETLTDALKHSEKSRLAIHHLLDTMEEKRRDV